MPRITSLSQKVLTTTALRPLVPNLGFSGTLARTLLGTELNYYSTADNDYVNISAVNGNIIVVGVQSEDSATGESTGVVHIINATTGSIINTIVPPVAQSSTNGFSFGSSVDINSQYIVVGHGDYNGAQSRMGRVYIYDHSGTLLRTIENTDTYGSQATDIFGSRVCLSDSYLLVSALYKEDPNGTFGGKCYLYDPSNGTLLQSIQNPNAASTSSDDAFGAYTALTDTHMIISANQEDLGGTDRGAAYVFSVPDATLSHTVAYPGIIFSPSPRFGIGVGINDTLFAVGSNENNSGAVFVFDINTATLQYTLTNPNLAGTAVDGYGQNISVRGNLLVIGARGEDVGGTASGTVYIHNISSGDLLHTLNNPNAALTPDGDQFGSVYTDGQRVLVGAIFEDDPNGVSTSVNSGAIYVYE